VISSKDRHLLKKLRTDEKHLLDRQNRITYQIESDSRKKQQKPIWRYISTIL